MWKYSVCIVGAGSIGALKDSTFDYPGGDAILTHAHAFHAHPDTEIVGFVDSDVDKATAAYKKWGTNKTIVGNFTDAGSFFIVAKPDIVVVSTPTNTHREILLSLLKLKEYNDWQPKLIVAEKPFCSSLREAEEAHDAYTAAKIPLLVNYIRHFDPVGSQVLDDLRDGVYGQIYHARCLYGRGIKRDGCHGLAAFNYVFGQPTGILINHPTVDDGCESGDASYNVSLEYKKDGNKVSAQMVAVDSRAWGAFELEFICERGVITLPKWGQYVAIRRPEAETTFGQYQSLGWPAKLDATALDKAMLYLVDNCVRHLRDGEPLRCTSTDALAVHDILKHIK